MKKVKIAALNAYVPERVVTNEEVEGRINAKKKLLHPGLLEKLFGIKERRYAAAQEQVSDMAVAAARPIVEEFGAANIDLLIFAAACSDLIEPATSNIIQDKLGLACPCMDIKNACNSFVSGIQAATAYIQSGMYENILIVNGEKLSDAVNYSIENEEHLLKAAASFTLGDAGAAMLLTKSEDEAGIYHQKFMTMGKHWDLCTIKGGGSMYTSQADKFFFEGKTAALKDAILKHSRSFVNTAMKGFGWLPAEIDHLITHQVSKGSFKIVSDGTGIPVEKAVSVFERFGNTAAASIPLTLHCAQSRQLLKKGDKVAVIGLAAGLSTSLQLLVWG